ncbi:MAG: hypothetical protein E4H20_11295, partial [Spirochaetales bacterium]
MKKTIHSCTAGVALAIILFSLSCAPRHESRAPDPSVVVAHSDGLVSRTADVSVVLTTGRATPMPERAQPFKFDPPLKGTVVWNADGSRADFRPDAPLAPGRAYHVVFDFSEIGEPSNGWFSFDIFAAEPNISVKPGDLYAAWNDTLALDGIVRVEDVPASADVERLVSAAVGALDLPISWSHEEGGLHRFTVKDVPRSNAAGELVLSWNGTPVGARIKDSRSYRVPASGEFEVLSVRGPEAGEPSCVTVSFSEPVDRDQDLRGLIDAIGAGTLRYETDGGLVRMYASLDWSDEVNITVEKGVRSRNSGVLAIPVQARVSFDWEKPEVRFPAGGVIVPSTQGTRVILETKNLAKVYVEALRVYGDNMLQFLQVNDLDGGQELKRVGEVVWSSEIDLAWTDDRKNQWTPYALDLSPLLAKHPDGLFQLRVAFSHDYIRYVCKNDHPKAGSWKFPPAAIIERDSGDSSYWDYYEEYFDWNEYYRYRDDPCHPAFYVVRYGRDRTARRNVLVSDVGIMAKRDADGVWLVAASDLKTARPLPGASARIYNYAMRELASGVADRDGLVQLKPSDLSSSEPTFLVVA